MSGPSFTGGQALGIFFRIPVRGMVKRRLASEIGPDAALDAYVAMVTATFSRISALKGIDRYGFFEGEAPGVDLVFPGVVYLRQDGRDLGEKMSAALNTLFGMGYGRAVLIGTDSPDLPLPFVDLAFMRLNAHDVVIGPSDDGGYYLIGLNAARAEIFQGISWGGAEVLEETLARARTMGLSVSLLPPWYDIDDATRLLRWQKGLAAAQADPDSPSQ